MESMVAARFSAAAAPAQNHGMRAEYANNNSMDPTWKQNIEHVVGKVGDGYLGGSAHDDGTATGQRQG